MKPPKKRKPSRPENCYLAFILGGEIFTRDSPWGLDAESAEHLAKWLIKAAAWLRANEKEKSK